MLMNEINTIIILKSTVCVGEFLRIWFPLILQILFLSLCLNILMIYFTIFKSLSGDFGVPKFLHFPTHFLATLYPIFPTLYKRLIATIPATNKPEGNAGIKAHNPNGSTRLCRFGANYKSSPLPTTRLSPDSQTNPNQACNTWRSCNVALFHGRHTGFAGGASLWAVHCPLW